MTKQFFYFILLLTLFSCSEKEETIPETATSGKLKLAFDESFLPIVKQEKEIFQYLYKYATLTDTSLSQEKAHELFLKDSVKLIFSARMLNDYETKYLKSINVFPKQYEFAEDGLVVILNRSNPDSVFTLEQLKGIVKGNQSKYSIVVESSTGASIVSFVRLLGLQKDSVKQVFSAETTKGIVDYVAQNIGAIGLMSSAWLSDMDSPVINEMLKRVKISRIYNPTTKDSYYPFQSELADSLYPLRRTIYVISRESQMGLANGFASFLLGEKGQRVVLKSGLLPSTIPSREVVLSKKSVY
jgi:phosphate transport system substrate-binding protein